MDYFLRIDAEDEQSFGFEAQRNIFEIAQSSDEIIRYQRAEAERSTGSSWYLQ